MRITANQIDQQSLSRFGEEAVGLLNSRDYESLAKRFGYALSYGREPAKAIEADLAALEPDEARVPNANRPSVLVKYFKPNDTNLAAIVECITRLPNGRLVLVELIVTTKATESHITLEQISNA